MTWRNDNLNANRLPLAGMVSRCVMTMTLGAMHKFGITPSSGFRGT